VAQIPRPSAAVAAAPKQFRQPSNTGGGCAERQLNVGATPLLLPPDGVSSFPALQTRLSPKIADNNRSLQQLGNQSAALLMTCRLGTTLLWTCVLSVSATASTGRTSRDSSRCPHVCAGPLPAHLVQENETQRVGFWVERLCFSKQDRECRQDRPGAQVVLLGRCFTRFKAGECHSRILTSEAAAQSHPASGRSVCTKGDNSTFIKAMMKCSTQTREA
jgi:hypothetical protein